MKFTNQRSPVIGTPEREFFMVNLIVSESYYPDLDMIFLLLDQLDKPKLIYYRCELPLFSYIYSTVTNPRK